MKTPLIINDLVIDLDKVICAEFHNWIHEPSIVFHFEGKIYQKVVVDYKAFDETQKTITDLLVKKS